MKKVFFSLILVSFLGVSCTPRDWFLVNSEGMMVYDRHKGTFEMIWETKAKEVVTIRDTVFVCPEKEEK